MKLTSNELGNRGIKSYNYGYMEQNSKPSALKLGEDSKDAVVSKQEAATGASFHGALSYINPLNRTTLA